MGLQRNPALALDIESIRRRSWAGRMIDATRGALQAGPRPATQPVGAPAPAPSQSTPDPAGNAPVPSAEAPVPTGGVRRRRGGGMSMLRPNRYQAAPAMATNTLIGR